jgi:hypothetical protein
MTEPIKTTAKLRCAIRCSVASEAVVNGFTRVLSRDHAVLDAAINTQPGWLTPGRQVTLAIELPPFRQEAPRVLGCSATVLRLRFVGGFSQLELEIQSMAIAKREYRGQSNGRQFV